MQASTTSNPSDRSVLSSPPAAGVFLQRSTY